MRRWSGFVSALALAAACSGNGEQVDVCADAAAVIDRGVARACEQHADCCVCTCFADGGKVWDVEQEGCACVEDLPGECSGLAEVMATNCLADEAACEQEAAASVEEVCARTPCDRQAELYAETFDDFCQGLDADCRFCACWNDGHKVVDPAEPAQCIEPEVDPVECTGEALQAAEACLADEQACEQEASDMALIICRYEHIGDACEEDGDCLFEMSCVGQSCELP
ncbi:MAG: hypothetical protein JXR96_08375 [Deltaproteobacteria bacterium]|nr:hypothetical protein [Deltaproteobacteria bacterium]